MSDNPCWGCNQRKVGCHGNCEAYADFDRENQRRRQENIDRHHSVNPDDAEYARRIKNAGARKRSKKCT